MASGETNFDFNDKLLAGILWGLNYVDGYSG